MKLVDALGKPCPIPVIETKKVRYLKKRRNKQVSQQQI